MRLNNLADAAKGTQNLMPFILTAVENYATLGEIADTLTGCFWRILIIRPANDMHIIYLNKPQDLGTNLILNFWTEYIERTITI